MKGLLFTYGLTYGGAIAAVANPFIGLCIYVAFAILKPDALWQWSVAPGPYSKIVFAGTVLGWLLQGCGIWKAGRARIPVLCLAGFWCWCVLSALMAPNQEVAWPYVDQMTKMHLPVLVGLTMLNSIERLRILAWVIILSQGFVAFELNVSYFRGYNMLHEQGFAGMDNNSAAIAFVTALGMAFFLGMHEQKPGKKAVCYAIAGFLAHAVLISFSRGGMLAMVIAAGVAFFVIPKQPKHYFGFAVAVLIGLSLAGNEVRARFSSTFAGDGEKREASAQSRLDLWRDCWDVIQKYPVLGAGPDHWPLLAHTYGWPKGKEAHSLWVQNAAELGIPGVLLLLFFYLATMKGLWPLAGDRIWVPDPWFRDAARMVVTSLTGFIISAQFVSLEALEIPYYVALVGAGTLRLLSLREAEAAADDDSDEHTGGNDFAEPTGPSEWDDDAHDEAFAAALTV